MIRLNGTTIIPTIFPDKTSQVWKVDLLDIGRPSSYIFKIFWKFENEAELFHLIQLKDLIRKLYPLNIIDLYMRYLPYARQDKSISNDKTFALHSFIKIIESLNFETVTVLDAHNPEVLPDSWINLIPNERIKEIINDINPDLICFPDNGAANRGYNTHGLPSFALEKVRDQSTGEITNLKLSRPLRLEDRNILMVDDLCDRGGTFMNACNLLKSHGTKEVYLYTTHGIYSGGTSIIFDSGINRIFNFSEEI